MNSRRGLYSPGFDTGSTQEKGKDIFIDLPSSIHPLHRVFSFFLGSCRGICTRIASAAPCRVPPSTLDSLPLPPPAGRGNTSACADGGPATSCLVPSRFKSARIHCEEGIAVTSYVPFFRLLLKKAVAQLPNDLLHYFAT